MPLNETHPEKVSAYATGFHANHMKNFKFRVRACVCILSCVLVTI